MRAFESKEALREREVGRLVRILTQVRAVGLVVVLLSLWALFLFANVNWQLEIMLALTALLTPIALFDAARLRRGANYVLSSAPIDLVMGLAMQAALIGLTGGIESPFLPVVAVIAFVSGAVVQSAPVRGLIVALALGILWLMAAGALFSWWPRTSLPMLGFEPGFSHQWRVVVAYASVLSFFTIVVWRIGRIVAKTVDRMLDEAIDARQTAFEAMAHKNAELVHLSGAIAHELKNPLASVQGLVQLVKRGGKNSEKRFEVLERELGRMRDVLDEFLNFSRPLGELTVEALDAREVMARVSGVHEGVAAERGVRITGPDGTVSFAGDSRKIGQALANLVLNAIDASPDDGTVTWIVSEADDTVTLGVTDEGPGMPPDILARATEVGATTKPQGSGIGLAVVATIAEQHGGRLELENIDDGGLSATLVLPKEAP